MGDEKSIVETIKEEVADAAKAVVAEVKAVAAEVAEAVVEGTADFRGHAEVAGEQDRPTPAGTASPAGEPLDKKDRQN